MKSFLILALMTVSSFSLAAVPCLKGLTLDVEGTTLEITSVEKADYFPNSGKVTVEINGQAQKGKYLVQPPYTSFQVFTESLDLYTVRFDAETVEVTEVVLNVNIKDDIDGRTFEKSFSVTQSGKCE